MTIIDNPCTRCGKQRIVVKVKRERINGSLVITTTTCCPDSECQKILDRKLKRDKDARERLVGKSRNPANPFNVKRKDIVLGRKKTIANRFAPN